MGEHIIYVFMSAKAVKERERERLQMTPSSQTPWLSDSLWLTHADSCLRWWDLQKNQRCSSHSDVLWSGPHTSHTHSRSHTGCGRYTGRLTEKQGKKKLNTHQLHNTVTSLFSQPFKEKISYFSFGDKAAARRLLPPVASVRHWTGHCHLNFD